VSEAHRVSIKTLEALITTTDVAVYKAKDMGRIKRLNKAEQTAST